MYPYSSLAPALPHATFHILLALSRGELHGYELKSVAHNDSLGSVSITDGTLYPTVKKLVLRGLIEEAGLAPAGPSGKPRLHYRITRTGTLCLKEELARMRHAVKIGENTGLFDDSTPLDIQRVIVEAGIADPD
jgi:DNA-binding PadR family transcriptional regulator